MGRREKSKKDEQSAVHVRERGVEGQAGDAQELLFSGGAEASAPTFGCVLWV